MGINSKYKQYYTWLQPGQGFAIENVKLNLSDGVSEFIAQELLLGIERINNHNIVKGTKEFTVNIKEDTSMPAEGFKIVGKEGVADIIGADSNGILYGVYRFLMKLSQGCNPSSIQIESSPLLKQRVINHWDNMTGNIERGYAGNSIFFKDNTFNYEENRIRDYARMLASIGINQISINNVNITKQSTKLITSEMLPEVAKLSDIFRPFGIRLILSVSFDSPVILGNLPSSDPKDEKVIKWWKDAVAKIYEYIPDFAGLLIKADSEHQHGPAVLGRTSADGASTIAKALKPYGGILYWRCFVYNCLQDWRDTKTDRPMAAYEHFYPFDGLFSDNVILQIKNGPVDFQVREPLSPLFGSMKHTHQSIEFQITQEYTGQQIDLYTLAVQWEETFASPLSDKKLLHDLIGNEITSIAAVSNIGDDDNWTGNTLAQCNLFAFGRLAWNPKLTAKIIIEEWIELTFGKNKDLEPLFKMMLESREVYEKYTSPLGIGWMVNIFNHYGPSVDGYEYSKWGTYHRADYKAIGVDRTYKGTGFTKQYNQYIAAIYNDKRTCPENLLLFFHRLPYDYTLKSGKTVIQHIYDSRYEGVEDVKRFIETWKSLETFLPKSAYKSVLERLYLQLTNAKEWRDVVNTYFLRKTGIADKKCRKMYE